jgi:hypothetical protein
LNRLSTAVTLAPLEHCLRLQGKISPPHPKVSRMPREDVCRENAISRAASLRASAFSARAAVAVAEQKMRRRRLSIERISAAERL